MRRAGSLTPLESAAGVLIEKPPEDFWWLNNGITIVADHVTPKGRKIEIDNPLVVNGLQTSNEIHSYFRTQETVADERSVLVRVVVPSTSTSRDSIIRATNNQTPIPSSSLRATDAIHRDIETFLQGHGFYYERRKNQYTNEGIPGDKIVSVPYLAQAMATIVLRRPHEARAHPTSLLKKDVLYARIFDRDYNYEVFLTCIQIRRLVESYFRSSGMPEVMGIDHEDVRHHVSMYAVYRLAGRASVKANDLPSLNLHEMDDSFLETCFLEVVMLLDDQCRQRGTTRYELSKSDDFTSLLIEELNKSIGSRNSA